MLTMTTVFWEPNAAMKWVTSGTWNWANDHSELKYFGRTPGRRYQKNEKFRKQTLEFSYSTISTANELYPTSDLNDNYLCWLLLPQCFYNEQIFLTSHKRQWWTRVGPSAWRNKSVKRRRMVKKFCTLRRSRKRGWGVLANHSNPETEYMNSAFVTCHSQPLDVWRQSNTVNLCSVNTSSNLHGSNYIQCTFVDDLWVQNVTKTPQTI